MKKRISYLLALIMSLNSIPAYANVNLSINSTCVMSNQFDSDELFLNVLNSIYQSQMNYLYNVINELENFYNEVDAKGIIKNGYRDAYQVLMYDFNCEYVSFGEYREFIPNGENITSDTYLKLIKDNYTLIETLKIKSVGNGRNPEYGLIYDNESLSFRKKTEEDIKLIEQYSEIIKGEPLVNKEVLLLEQGTNLSIDDLLSVLESILSGQVNYILSTQNNLKEFFETKDTKNIIKNGYRNAYNATYYNILDANIFYNGVNYEVARDFSKENKELLQEYMDMINEYNNIIYSFRIKAAGNGRDPEYGIIIDDSEPLGFRKKTEEDKILIDKYTDLLGDLSIVPNDLIRYLEYVVQEKRNSVVKIYENK